MKKILIFTGAGFCVPFDLPTTSGFQMVIDNHFSNEFGLICKSFLKEKFNDIEELLSTIELFNKNDTLLRYIVLNYEFRDRNKSGWFDEVRRIIDSYKQISENGIVHLKASIFEILAKYSRQKAIAQYSGLLRELKGKYPDSAISMFTTNYDLTFEDSQDDLENIYSDLGIEDVDYGFTNKNKSQRYYFNENKLYKWDSKILEYKKLHGSLDWSLDDQKRCVKLGNIVNPSNLEQMLLLYPGFKGTPDDQPYISLHEQLLERLLTVDDIYVIGFAFRDDFINNQFEIALRINKSLQIHCYNPIDLTSLPLKSKIQYFIRKYPTKFSYIQQGITADSENPLVLNIKNGITIN